MAVDSEYSENADEAEGTEAPETDPRSKVRFWYDWLKDAKEAAKTHKRRANAAWRDYDLESVIVNEEVKEKKEGGFAVYFSGCKHLEAAYYAKTPTPRGKRRFGIDDDVAGTAALMVERLGVHFVEKDDFDAVIERAVQDFIHADKATVQAVAEPTEPDIIEIPVLLVAGPNGQPAAVTQDGKPVAIEEVVQGADGRLYQRIEESNPTISLLPLGYDEILHSPNARTESEIKEKAFRITLDEFEVEDRFYTQPADVESWEPPPLGFDELPWVSSKNDEDDPEDEPVKRLVIWEIYCDATKKIYWVTDKQCNQFLDKRDNKERLSKRFPCTPFIISNTPKKNLYPTPTHTHIKPYLDALDELWYRIRDLIPKIERKAILDEKLKAALDQLDQGVDYVTVKNLAEMIEGSGDLRKMIQFVPLGELVQAIQEASGLIDIVDRYFNEHFGVPDILRGQADPMNAADTNRTMAQAAHDRFKKNRRAVQKMVRDAIELCIEMALDKWSPRKIWAVTGFQFEEAGHQQRFMKALEMLRDDKERFIRIDIETDSTSFADEVADTQKAQALSQVITQGLATIGGAQNQEYVPILLEMLLITVEHMGGSAKHADDIKKAVADLQKRKQQQPQQGEQDPAAATKAQEQQTKLQVAQMESQVDMAQAQMSMAQHQAEMPLKQAELQLKIAEANLEREKIALEYAKLGQERAIQDMSMLETAAKTAGTIQKEQLDTEQAQIDFAGKVTTATSQNLQAMKPPATEGDMSR